MSRSFYNTTHECGHQLEFYHARAASQEARILEFFERNRGMRFTPFDVHKACFYANTPVTSIRRAITNLTREGKLVKTTDYEKGVYGNRNHKWQLSEGPVS